MITLKSTIYYDHTSLVVCVGQHIIIPLSSGPAFSFGTVSLIPFAEWNVQQLAVLSAAHNFFTFDFILLYSQFILRILTLKGTYYEELTFSVFVHLHLGIWSVYQPINCEIWPPSHFFVGCLSLKTWDSTHCSDLISLLKWIRGSFE